MILLLKAFVLGLILGVPLWMLLQVFWPRRRRLAALQQHEVVPVQWVSVVRNGRLVREESEPGS